MLGFLQQPYMFAIALAVLTSVLVYLFSRVTETDKSRPTKTFFKTLVAGTVAGVGLTYLTTAKADVVATEPFDVIPSAAGL